MVVVGSLSPLSQQQVEQLAQRFPLPRLEVSAQGRLELDQTVQELVLVTWARGVGEFFQASTPLERVSLGQQLVNRLGQAVAALAEGRGLKGLVLTGGDTTLAVCRALGAVGLQPWTEVEPGIPFSSLVGGAYAGTFVLTKPGGFGHPLSLVRCVEFLLGR